MSFDSKLASIPTRLAYVSVACVLSAAPTLGWCGGDVPANSGVELRAPEASMAGAVSLELETGGEGLAEGERIEVSRRVVQSGASRLERVYLGPGPTAFISGLPEGSHDFQARLVAGGQPGAWSKAVTVAVSFPSHASVWASLLFGALIFASTLIVIFVGARGSREGASAT